ncbi:MAG: restriction endonuclease subunit S [Verrucomicrobiae bacterium]|nr:restriction endonuclease subunit S [Verrucomicrobiae bacterium]
MEGEWKRQRIADVFAVNPPREITRGSVTPFLPMDALPENERAPRRFESRAFTGSGAKFQNGDTLIARITPCLENGKTAFVSGLKHGEIGHGSTEFIVLAGRPGESDNLFAYYLARSPDFRRYAIARMEGTSGRQRVPTVAVENFRTEIPPLAEQRAIAHILGTLDDKIELNRRMNETLEAIARAIFKSWFVDFDPVRAKASGEPPESICRRLGLTPDLLALFPDRLVDSELGEIPEGWGVGRLDEEFDLTMGQSPPGETYNEVGNGIPFYQGRADFESRFPKRRVYCSAPKKLAKRGDTLISVRAPVGAINMAAEDCAIGRGVAAARHKSGSRSYTYQFMHSLEAVFSRFEAEGTVFGSISKSDLHGIPCLVPPAQVVASFETILVPLDDLIEIAAFESRTLAALRDTLLPKLISGELRVPLEGAA